MKPHFKLPCTILATALAAALQLAAHASAVPLAWEARPGNPAPAQFTRYHGETLALRCTLAGFDGDLSAQGDVRLWFQTNGMGRLWWSVPACAASNRIEAAFGAAEDVGADRVSLFLGSPSNVYASAVLRLMPSPGFTPADLSLPVLKLDFDALAVTNAPYYTKAETDAKIVELAPIPDVSQKADKVKTVPCVWSASCTPIYSHPFPLAQMSPTTWRFTSGPKRLGGPSISLERKDGYWEFYAGSANGYDYFPATNAAPTSATNLEFEVVYARLVYDTLQDFATNVWSVTRESVVEIPVAYLDDVPTSVSQLENDIPFATPGDVATAIPPAVSNIVTKSYVEDLGIESGLQEEADPVWSAEKSDYATKTALATVEGKADAAALDASSALRIVLGESVWFAVTNYMRTAEGVIPSLQLWEVRDSVTNLVYDSREEITNTVKALTRELHTELTNRIHAVSNAMPSKAWGNYQSDGTDNPEPGKVAIVNQPTVILTGGGTFNKYVEIGDSSIWVLTSSGPVSFGGGGTNGNYFAVLDDEGNAHFKVSKTDSFDVEAIFTDNPRTSGDALLLYICSTNRQGESYIGPPTLSACTNLQAAVWHDEADGEIDALGTSVAWARNDTIHAWVGTVTQDRWATAMFFRAKMKQEGGTAIINTAPVRFDGGIQLGNGKYRLVPYTTGGKTYLTVEGLQ